MSTKTTSGSMVMRPRARLISLIGEELISDEPVAIVELVKNAYDADSATVHVIFEGKDPERPERIVISDDGHGMSIDTVLNSWLEPGTSFKRVKQQSPGGRVYQGAKGIGRFASARLGETLLLESTNTEADTTVTVLIDWGRFDETSYLDQISVDYSVEPRRSRSQGTTLTIDGLRLNWRSDDFETLYTRLSRLISPFQEVKDFEIFLDIPVHPQFSGQVEPPELILKPKYLLKGSLSKKGLFNGTIAVDGKTKPYKNTSFGGNLGVPLCGSLEFEIRVWDRDREGLEPYLNDRTTITEIRKTLDNFSGVSIYRDGFRVYPYGQRGNDWLKLDNRSRQNPVMHLANNQIVSAIKISRVDNPGLKDRSNREGLVHTQEFDALQVWFIEVLKLLENARYDVRPRKKTADSRKDLFQGFDVSAVVQQAKKELGPRHPVTKSLTDAEEQIKQSIERVEQVFSTLLMSAGIGHMVDIVLHEIGSPLGKTNREVTILENSLKTMLGGSELQECNESIESIRGWLEQIHNLRARLDPHSAGKRGKAVTFDVLEEIRDNISLYESLIKKQRIKCDPKLVGNIGKVKMSRAAFGQVIGNLLDNSIYWLVHNKGARNGGQIEIGVEPFAGGFKLTFADDGPGVELEDQIRIFEPYFTRKPTGVGLGLYIARLLMEPYGRIIYQSEGPLSGACFELYFERGVGL